VVVDAVLRIRRGGLAPQALRVRLVVAEQRLGLAVAGERHRHVAVARDERPVVLADHRRPGAVAPRPPGAEPQRGENVQLCVVGPRVADADAQAQVLRPGLRVVDLDVPVAVVGHRVGVEQLVLRIAEAAACVLGDEVLEGKARWE
jgi:hypothetical protein